MEYQVEKITRQIKIEKIIHRLLKFIILVILGILLTISLIMFYKTNVSKEEIPYFGEYAIYNIVSESMEPQINVNDLIIIEKCEESELKVKDVITYKRQDGSIITHRIIQVNNFENKPKEYTTKGDNNETEDKEKIEYAQIYGKYLFRVKGAGKIAETIQENNGIMSVALIILIFITLKNGTDRKKEERKKVREKYDIKKKRDKYAKIKEKNN